ncbi:MAG: glycosyltransferase [Bacteroidetes bacterium]|nr:MAG: glycosyltransferase [Bacteroidota bacterium]TAG89880.1 MAG: glycosyltransferase [Bacteroidota bacterium]
MKVLFLNTYEKYGGAAMACYRLYQSLKKNTNATYHLLVSDIDKNNENTNTINPNFIAQKIQKIKFITERLSYWAYMKNKSLKYAFSPANVGQSIINNPLVKNADILHLNWINFGFLSLNELEKICQSDKKIIWTMHDMWAFTGGCHYAGACENFYTNCGNCQFLKKPSIKDWSFQIFERKKEIIKNKKITFVGSSNWITKQAQKSGLFNENHQFYHIPTPIDTEIFKPLDKEKLRQELKNTTIDDKFLLLFGAMNIADKRKGFHLLLEALQILAQKNKKLPLHLLIFGKSTPEMLEKLPFDYTNLGVLKGDIEIRKAYNLAHTFVLPSLEDNLPNTILESLACGTPSLSFNLGGMPEMIDNELNGLITTENSAENLAENIKKMIDFWINKPDFFYILQENARKKAMLNYSEKVVAEKYFSKYS